MNAYLSDAGNARSGNDRPPVLIAGSSQAALDRAAVTVSAAGLRIADQVWLAAAPERIDLQVTASAVWLELDGDDGESLDRLLEQVDRDVANGRIRRWLRPRRTWSMRWRRGSVRAMLSW